MSRNSVDVIARFPSPGTNAYDLKEFSPEVVEHCLNSASEEVTAKVILVGDFAVGKTALIQRLCTGNFTSNYKATIGLDFFAHTYEILGRQFILNVWDTAGDEKFRAISKSYYRGASAVVLAFDLGNTKSFENTSHWYREVLSAIGDISNCPLFLVGCKADLYRTVEEREVLSQATQLNAEVFYTSSKEGTNIRELFRRISALVFERTVQSQISVTEGPSRVVVHLDKGSRSECKKKKKRWRC